MHWRWRVLRLQVTTFVLARARTGCEWERQGEALPWVLSLKNFTLGDRRRSWEQKETTTERFELSRAEVLAQRVLTIPNARISIAGTDGTCVWHESDRLNHSATLSSSGSTEAKMNLRLEVRGEESSKGSGAIKYT